MNKQNINVLVIPTWYPSGVDKLMGIYHKEFCAALAKRDNIKVNMLYIERQPLKNPLKYLYMKKLEIIKEDGYDVYLKRILDIRKISFDSALKSYVKSLDSLFKEYLKTNESPDVIHAQVTIPAGYAACVLGKKYNIPVVVTEHASYYKRFFNGNFAKYGNFVLDNSYFTTVSKYMQTEILKLNKNCKTLGNLVDTDIFKKNRHKIKDLKIVTVSALRKLKNIDDLIKALKIIIEEKNIPAKLTIVGDGFDEAYYKSVRTELKMDNYVDFVGRKTKQEIADILIENNIYVIASEIETFGIPGIEALASGMPVVSTKCLGPEEYIDDKCGKLVPVGDIDGLAEAIIDTYRNIDKYDIEYLRSVADKYSKGTITKEAIKIYKEVIENQKET